MRLQHYCVDICLKTLGENVFSKEIDLKKDINIKSIKDKYYYIYQKYDYKNIIIYSTVVSVF